MSVSPSPLGSRSQHAIMPCWYFLYYHSISRLSRSRVYFFRFLRLPADFYHSSRRAVRGATRRESTTEPFPCQIGTPVLFKTSRGFRFFRCWACPALGRSWRNGGGFYHRAADVSNSTACALRPTHRFGLSGARPFQAQRGGTLPLPRHPVKSRPPCSQTHSLLRFVRCSPVSGATGGDFTTGRPAGQIRVGCCLEAASLHGSPPFQRTR